MQNRLSLHPRDRFATALTALLLLATLFCSFTEFAYDGYIPILLVTMLLCVSVRGIRLTSIVRRLFDLCNAVNILCAVSLLLEIPTVAQFFLTHYAFGYDELLPYMFSEGKPVIMFGSHSVAGFFFYLLFYLTFQTFAACRSKLNLVYSICYICLLASLYSFTSVVFTSVAIIQVILHFQWHKSFVAGTLATALALVALVALLIGRYSSSSGGLLGNLEYIAEHPFRPIGVGLSRHLWYADLGPVEYLLKGSFPLLLTVYGGAFFFFYENLLDKRQAVFLFLVFLSFELGYSNLQYIRTQFFLPFLLVYVNGLEASNCSRWLCA